MLPSKYASCVKSCCLFTLGIHGHISDLSKLFLGVSKRAF